MTTKELNGVAHELKFWAGFVKTERFLKGWVADCVTPELNHKVYDFIHGMLTQSPERDKVKVLDVGSGVVSILNGLVPKKNLTAVDPLGELYEIVFDYGQHGIKSPLPVPAEEMKYLEEFDIVHISNALDHTQNPKAAFDRLLEATKPGGFLIIQGFENEATYEKWQGFHQWNIYIDGNKDGLAIEGKDGLHAAIRNPYFADVTTFENNKSWFIFIVKK